MTLSELQIEGAEIDMSSHFAEWQRLDTRAIAEGARLEAALDRYLAGHGASPCEEEFAHLRQLRRTAAAHLRIIHQTLRQLRKSTTVL